MRIRAQTVKWVSCWDETQIQRYACSVIFLWRYIWLIPRRTYDRDERTYSWKYASSNCEREVLLKLETLCVPQAQSFWILISLRVKHTEVISTNLATPEHRINDSSWCKSAVRSEAEWNIQRVESRNSRRDKRQYSVRGRARWLRRAGESETHLAKRMLQAKHRESRTELPFILVILQWNGIHLVSKEWGGRKENRSKRFNA